MESTSDPDVLTVQLLREDGKVLDQPPARLVLGLVHLGVAIFAGGHVLARGFGLVGSSSLCLVIRCLSVGSCAFILSLFRLLFSLLGFSLELFFGLFTENSKINIKFRFLENDFTYPSAFSLTSG